MMKRLLMRARVDLLPCHRYTRRQRSCARYPFGREFRTSAYHPAIRTQKLGDVGEGITECMLNMWFVEEGARVEEWDKLCEMQSDKAAVEISLNYSGVIKKLYAQPNDMVKTGSPLADIDDGLPEEGEKVEEAKVEEAKMEEAKVKDESAVRTREEQRTEDQSPLFIDGSHGQVGRGENAAEAGAPRSTKPAEAATGENFSKRPLLATPAVRGLLKEHNIDISEVTGSGRDGRILKEDVEAYLRHRNMTSSSPSIFRSAPSALSRQSETVVPLSPTQVQMFRTMTASLAIPHFLYTDEVNTTHLSDLRRRLNQSRERLSAKVTQLPFVLKAVSIALNHYPLLNARLDSKASSSGGQLIYRSSHNIGIAVDTPAGLLVPVVKNVGALSLMEIAQEIRRLSELAKAKKLSSADLAGGTITVSNIGNIGGTVVSPIIVEGQVAILGVGKSRVVPVIGEEEDSIQKAEITHLSWSADHRVVDGATAARMGSMVKNLLEEPAQLMFQMR